MIPEEAVETYKRNAEKAGKETKEIGEEVSEKIKDSIEEYTIKGGRKKDKDELAIDALKKSIN